MGGGTQRARSRYRCRVRPAESRCHCLPGNRKCSRQPGEVIPIVFAGGDPVGTGLILSLAQPDGNVPGLSLRHRGLAGKRLELLRDVVPALRRLAILGNAGNPVALQDMREVEVAAGAPDLTVVAVKIWRVEDIAAGFEALKARADMFRA